MSFNFASVWLRCTGRASRVRELKSRLAHPQAELVAYNLSVPTVGKVRYLEAPPQGDRPAGHSCSCTPFH